MVVDDRAFAAHAARIAEASRERVGRLRTELAEHEDTARGRAREHLQRMVGLAEPGPGPVPRDRKQQATGDDDESFADRRWLR